MSAILQLVAGRKLSTLLGCRRHRTGTPAAVAVSLRRGRGVGGQFGGEGFRPGNVLGEMTSWLGQSSPCHHPRRAAQLFAVIENPANFLASSTEASLHVAAAGPALNALTISRGRQTAI